MKIGTTPKITIGAIGIIVLLYIGFGVHQMIWSKFGGAKDVSSSVQTAPQNRLAGIDTNQKMEDGKNQRQISDKEMAQIKNFFAQLDVADAQSDAARPPAGSKATLATANTEASSKATEQSAEDVMNACIEALKNCDFEELLPLTIGTAREEIERQLRILNGEMPEDPIDSIDIMDYMDYIIDYMVDYMPEGMSEEMIDNVRQTMLESLQNPPIQEIQETQEMMQVIFSQTEIVSSEYVENEFHFHVRIPMPEVPELPELLGGAELPEMLELTDSAEAVFKMQKVDGVWLIYDMEELN